MHCYTIEVHTYGLLICAAPGAKGISLAALSECGPLAPPDAVVSLGIAHHYKVSTASAAFFAVASAADVVLWQHEIAADLARRPLSPAVRWWWGTDVGLSSATIFSVLSDSHVAEAAREYSQGATPGDEDDLGRCRRLLALFPAWIPRLYEVSAKFPQWAPYVEKL